jgi:hypothetical protein
MGYCTITEIDRVLAQSLTSATNPDSQARRNLLQIGSVRDKNTIPDSIVEQYIQWAGQEIDSHLSEVYKVPLCELADFEGILQSDIGEYNDYIVLERNCPLTSGDEILITDGEEEERHEIDDSVGDGIFSTVETIIYPFEAGSRVLRIKYPDPIPFVCSRLAAANIYDKYFSSQVSPAISDYGKYLRAQSRQKINDIMNGRTILHGIHRIGRRLFDPTITDQYGLPQGDSQRNTDEVS